MLDILFFFIEILLEVLFAALRGDLKTDDEGKGRKEPIPYTPEETLEFSDCAMCGKPNPVEHVFCKACGALLETART